MTRNVPLSAPPAGTRPAEPRPKASKSTAPRPKRTRTRKVVRTGFATGCLALGVVCIPLSLLMYDVNFLLMMPLAITALVCGFLARRAGAPRILAYPLMLVALIPIAIAGRVLILLLLNNPVRFHLNGIQWVEN